MLGAALPLRSAYPIWLIDMSGSVEDDLLEVKQRLQQSRQKVPAVDDLRQFLKLVSKTAQLMP